MANIPPKFCVLCPNMSAYFQNFDSYQLPKTGMDWMERTSDGSTSTLTTCSAVSSVDLSEDYGSELLSCDLSFCSLSSEESTDESSSASPLFRKLKRSREIPIVHNNARARSENVDKEESQLKRQNVSLVRPVPRYAPRFYPLQQRPVLVRPLHPRKSMCATLGIFKPVLIEDETRKADDKSSAALRAATTVHVDQNVAEEEDAELALYFDVKADKSVSMNSIVDIPDAKCSRPSSNLPHSESICDPLMCIFNMDL